MKSGKGNAKINVFSDNGKNDTEKTWKQKGSRNSCRRRGNVNGKLYAVCEGGEKQRETERGMCTPMCVCVCVCVCLCVTFSFGVDESTERSRLLDGSISIGEVTIVALLGDVQLLEHTRMNRWRGRSRDRGPVRSFALHR